MAGPVKSYTEGTAFSIVDIRTLLGDPNHSDSEVNALGVTPVRNTTAIVSDETNVPRSCGSAQGDGWSGQYPVKSYAECTTCSIFDAITLCYHAGAWSVRLLRSRPQGHSQHAFSNANCNSCNSDPAVVGVRTMKLCSLKQAWFGLLQATLWHHARVWANLLSAFKSRLQRDAESTCMCAVNANCNSCDSDRHERGWLVQSNRILRAQPSALSISEHSWAIPITHIAKWTH
jgi:hypothetical protein